MCSAKRGFTLIELSIALVIIALVVAGVMTGRELIYLGKLRSTVAQVEMLDNATNAFRNKYGCLPGDCVSATTRFGLRSLTAGAYTGGNSNGIISYTGGPSYGEMWDYWRQLKDAGMTKSDRPDFLLPHTSYTGPACYASNNGWMVYHMPEFNWFGGYQLARDLAGHAYSIMQCHYNQWADYITPQTAYDIDAKLDNGSPSSGRVRSGISQTTAMNATGTNYNTGLNGSCITNTGGVYTYTLSNTNYACSIFIKANF